MEFPGEKLAEKLWETVTEKGIGKLLSPWQIRREGIAHAEVRAIEKRLLAQADADEIELRAGRKRLHKDGVTLLSMNAAQSADLQCEQKFERVEPTFNIDAFAEEGMRQNVANAARSEINATRALLYAEDSLLRSDQRPGDTHVDEDWLFTWREYVGKVSSDDLQKLWGNVLAGEVKSPGLYSLRTLDFLRTLSKAEAVEISKVAPFVVSGRIIRMANEYLNQNGVSFDMLIRLQALGILTGVDLFGAQVQYRSMRQNQYLSFLAGRTKALQLTRPEAQPPLQLAVYSLTELGKQVLSLGEFETDIGYLTTVGKKLKEMGFTVAIGDWKSYHHGLGYPENLIEM